MKRKIGFLAVVAIAAMSFTLATNAKLKTDISNCYTSVTINGTTYTQGGSSLPPTGKKVTSHNTAATVTCNGGTFFCCATLKQVGVPAHDEIDQIFLQP
jgi:hypothetical protein